jgi:hypothetical protein
VEQLQEKEKRASESAWFFYSLEPSAIDGTRSSVDPKPQCIGAGSIHALNISNQQRLIHCGCSQALFRLSQKLQFFFLFVTSIFGRMHGAVNVDKKITNYTI